MWTNRGLADLVGLAVGGGGADLRLMLVNTAPASAAAAADINFVADVVANEITPASYARQVLAGEASSFDAANDEALLSATDPGSLGNLETGDTIRGAWVFRQVTDDADSVVWCFLAITDTPTNGGEVTLAFGTATDGSTKAISTFANGA